MTDDLPRLIRRLDLDRMRRYQEALDLYAGNHWPAGPRSASNPDGELHPDGH